MRTCVHHGVHLGFSAKYDHQVANHRGAPFIISELLEVESLRKRMKDGALPWRKAVEWARQAAEGLAAAK